MLEAEAADPGQQQLSTALLQAQSNLGEGVAIIDPQTQRFVYVNDALCQLYGYSAAELLALPSFLTLIVPEEQSAFCSGRHADFGSERAPTGDIDSGYHSPQANRGGTASDPCRLRAAGTGADRRFSGDE